MANDTEQDVKRILRTMAGNLTPNSAITEQVRSYQLDPTVQNF